MRRFRLSRSSLEPLPLLLAAVAILFFMTTLGVFKRIGDWIGNSAAAVLGDLLLTMAVLVVCLGWFACRRRSEPVPEETACAEGELRAKAMLEAIPDLMFRMNRDGVFLDYKAETRDLYAQTGSLIGKRNRDVAPPEFADLVQRRIEAALETGTLQTFEYQLPIPGRGVRDYEARMVPSGAEEVTAIVRDVTSRKRIATALENAKQQWETTFDAISDWVSLVDESHTIVRSNKSVIRFIGIPPKEAVGKRCYELVHCSVDPHPECPVSRALKSGHWEEMEFQAGDGRWLRVSVDPVNHGRGGGGLFVHVVQDVSKRKQAEDLLRQSEERYRVLTEKSFQAIAVLKGIPPVIAYVNPAWVEIFGYTEEEALSFGPEKLWDLVHPDDRDIVRGWNLDRLNGSPVNSRYELRIVRKDGTTRWVEQFANLIESDGEPLVQSVCVDITERKEIEAEKARFEEQNRQLQKAESLGRMAGAIAHHFNNMLAAVMGNLELALDELSETSLARRCVVESMKASARAAEVSRRMLAYLGQFSGSRIALDLGQVIRESIPLLGELIPFQVHLELQLPPKGPIVLGDVACIRQIALQLVSNSVEAMEDGDGSITVAVQTVKVTETAPGRFFPPDWEMKADEYACLSVADTGAGMEESTQERLFDPFFSTRFIGRGMGLAVVLGLVRAHNGAIAVESELGRGTVFRTLFPVHPVESLPRESDVPAAALNRQ